MRRTLVLMAAFAFVLAACGGGAGATPAGATPAGAGTVAVASSSLGDILVGSNGKTLYGFTPDVGQATPTCTDTCAATWPPLTGAATAGTGVDQAKLTTVQRADGSSQLKYGDYPLYFYAPDTAAGQTNGQGVGGKWFVVAASGQLIQ